MLSTRILTALVLVPLVLAGIFLLPPKAWAAVSLVIMVAAAVEWANLVDFRRELRVLFVIGVLLIMLNLLFTPMSGFDQGWPDGIVLAVCGPATLLWLLVVPFWLRERWRASSRLGAAVTGWLILVGAWVAIVVLQARSPWYVLAAMAVVWIADTAAYFTGRAWGRHKLAPWISPGKTWEGVAGGLVAVAIYAVVLLFVAGDGFIAAYGLRGAIAWVAFVVAVAALSVTGDLLESLLKRHAGVKDSGWALPGHGGILDRIDALMAAMPPLALAALVFLR